VHVRGEGARARGGSGLLGRCWGTAVTRELGTAARELGGRRRVVRGGEDWERRLAVREWKK
jgi:hypothetical protein